MAAGSTYTPIATTTLSSAAASYTFSSIPSTYTDLVLISAPIYTATTAARYTINADTGANYSATYVAGNGTTAASTRVTSNTDIILDYYNHTSTATPNQITHFFNYSNTTTYKTFLSRSNDAAAGTDAAVGLWRSTSAITSIKLAVSTGNFNIGSTFTLYGIQAA